MRLKCIKLVGFKSFVDATTVNFPSNMSAVVGPNGCGKSNIIDAVRWVMGESSAKHLRGESMTDVIFNGSVGRKPVGQASIELVFDNTQGKLGGQYSAFNEIAIKRQVTRDGQSDYYLNGAKCRRRDITDIFLGTGLGARSYAIIEQGMISKLIEAKPDELRVFLEEAAGISKYKERRRDTENRIRRTRENLERLTDIRDELSRQLNRLKRQSLAAERYKELKQQERTYKAQLQALQWQRYDGQYQTKNQAIVQQELKVEESVTAQVSVNTKLEQLNQERAERNDVLSTIQTEYYTYGAEIARLEQIIQNQKERQKQLEHDSAQTQQSIESLQEHLQLDQQQLDALSQEFADIEPQQQVLQASRDSSTKALAQAETVMLELQQRWETFTAEQNNEQRKAEVEQSRIQHFEQVLESVKDRLDGVAKENQSLVSAPVEQEIVSLLSDVEHIELQLQSFQEETLKTKGDIDLLREKNNQLQTELSQKRSELQKMQGRFASLEALQQVSLGKKNSSVETWLEQHQLNTQPRLAQQLTVSTGYELAVETVLGDYLQAVCIDGFDSIKDWISNFDEGRVVFIDQSIKATQLADTAKPLLDYVSGSDYVSGLLSGIYIAKTLQEAMALRSSLASHESIITQDGIWIGASWLRVNKQVDEQSGVLLRQQEIQELDQLIQSKQHEVERLQAQNDEDRQQLITLENYYQEQQSSQAENNRKHAEIKSVLSAQQVKVEQIQQQKSRLESESQQLQMQFDDQRTHLKGARSELENVLEKISERKQQRESLQAEREAARAQLQLAREQASQDKEKVLEVTMRAQALTTQVDHIKQNIVRINTQLHQLTSRSEALKVEKQNWQQPDTDYQADLAGQLEKHLDAEHRLQEMRSQLNSVEFTIRENEQNRQQADAQTQRLRSELESKRLAAQEDKLRCATLIEQLETAGHELDSILDAMPQDASEQVWQQEIETVAKRIAKLGAINLAAIDEFNIESERKLYLDRQFEDLSTALETLSSAIRKIDKETKERFKETYDNVNAGLQELFPKVFGGGSASLELMDNDLLNTGVLIKARPPGKRNSTIHLLSGGEKALTAIALVFSIFRLNPAPFCMLDEVDAPLDDANVGRYANLVHEMSKQVQFIYITHNKITMEYADQLLGVTMHEPGVSRMVTVDVQEAVDLVAV